MINFLNISYLKLGNDKQQKAYQVITDHAILEKLAQYNPILVGTIPIDIDIEKSDLDIICYAQDREEFRKELVHHFHSMKGFIISENQKLQSMKANFFINGFEIEIFGQNIPTELQNAYRHMLVEHKILLENNEDFRKQIIDLKRQGYKTEPAFAKLLALKGDAYEALLKLEI
ncbi:diadenosine tetraphosphate hydrolase [Pedobacter sp. Leaf41]|uniref:DUF4269 domain-containing protein n=1 Tax=Pedobacter sp. Leaf41 TaxID=1736218 RepID=UPI000703A7EF|nr:DUF4269 domain-containing protein [Pedobacter sp. Leaf41]KQN38250.1 diadenosine tetraphosphate hydrolase [Pedobacter sp. Leaf41]